MGLFYAHLPDESGHHHYLIAFADREAADEWWRTISAPPSPYTTNVRRISPQLYTQNDGVYNNVTSFFSNAKLPDAKEFRQRMYFLYCKDMSVTIPPVSSTDHISGRWYFILSKVDPHSHWYLRINGGCLVCGDANCNAIHVSSEYRTKFCIQACEARDDPQEPKSFVMIGKDKISVTARGDYIVHIDGAGELKATRGYQGETDLLFGDLKNRFVARAEKKFNGEVWEYVEPVERDSGEAWELVD